MGSEKTKTQMNAREWLFVIAAGAVIAVVGAGMDGGQVTPIGVLIALVGLFGLAWRLLKDR